MGTAEEAAERWRRTCEALSAVLAAARAAVAAWAASAEATRIDCRMADLSAALMDLDRARKGG